MLLNFYLKDMAIMMDLAKEAILGMDPRLQEL